MRPFATEAMYAFKASNPSELTIYAGQTLKLAPREVQQTHKLLNTGWALATIDDKTSGLVPINYLRRQEASNARRTNVTVDNAEQGETETTIPETVACEANDKIWNNEFQPDDSGLSPDDLERLRDV